MFMHPSRFRLSLRHQYKNLFRGIQNVCLTVSLVLGITVLAPHSNSQTLRPAPAPSIEVSAVVPNEVLVGVRADQDDAQEAYRLNAAVGVAVGWQPELHTYRVHLQPGMTIGAAIARLRQRGDVVFAEPNHIYHVQATPNNPYYGNQWGPQKVQANLAWDIWNPSATIVIAIVDTGIDNTHPALTNKIYRDALGIVGYNAFTGLRDNASDDYGHGTHCAGIAAAQINNGIGVAGIAGWTGQASVSDTTYTKLMPVKVLDGTGSGSDSSVANGILWAANNGARVISLSLGGPDSSITLGNAVAYAWNKGCVVVAAAGNSGVTTPSYPGAYPNVISVAATDSNDQLASFSNYGSWVTVAAPGVGIYSTVPTYAAGGNFGLNYNYLSGTSMATPHVAGEAALLLAQNPALTNSQVSALITSNVDPYTPYSGNIAPGAGRINVYRALKAAGGGAARIPNAPTSLVAAPGNAQINLGWSGSAGALAYNVKRSLVNGGPYLPLASGVTTATYTDSGLTNGTTYYYVVSAVNATGESAASTQASATPATQTTVYKIHSGSGVIGAFNPDSYFNGGSLYTVSQAIDTSAANAAPMAVYQTQRYGNFAYNMPSLTPGSSYTARLHFAESYFTIAGQRYFNVAINSTTVLANFDIATAAGGVNKALVMDFTAVADSNGNINITFTKGTNWPLINAIEIIH
jgi:thermitase